MMKRSLVPLTFVLLSLGATACGGSHGRLASKPAADAAATGGVAAATPSRTSATRRGLVRDRDGDRDNPTPDSRYDQDDEAVLHFGHAASAADERAIAALVKRYYVAAAAGDGVTACRLIYSVIAESVVEEYGQLPALRGRSCPAVVSKLFRQHRSPSTGDAGALEVIRVRVDAGRGVAIVRFGRLTERQVVVRREGGAWKLAALGEVGLP
jgi:hypothetical protein